MGIILLDTSRRIAGSQSFDLDTSTIDLGVDPRGQQVTGESTLVTLFLVRSQAADSSAHCLFGQSIAPSNPGLQYNIVRDGSGIYVFSGIVNSAYAGWAAAGSTNYGISLDKWTYIAAVNHGGTGYTFRHYRAIVGEEQSFLDISYNSGGQSGSLPSGFGAAVRIGNRTIAASNRLDGEIALTARWDRALSIEELDEVLDKGPLAVPRAMILFYAEGRDWGPFGVATVSNTSARTGAPPDRPRLVSRRVPLVSAAAGVTHYTLTAEAGSYSLTGSAATLKAGRKLAAAAGSYALTGSAATLRVGRTVVAAAGSYTLTGNAATLVATRKLAASAGSYTLTGSAAGLGVGRKIAAESGAYALTGASAGLTATRKIVADAGAYTLTGADATLVYTPAAGAYTLTADGGSYALNGADAALAAARKLAAAAGAYTLTGADATLTRSGYRLVAEAGAYTLTGSDATITTTGTVEVTATQSAGGVRRRRRVILRDKVYDVPERDIPALIEAVLRDATPPATAQEPGKPAPKRRKARKVAKAAEQAAPVESPSVDMVAERIAAIRAELDAQAQMDVMRMLDRIAARVLMEAQDEDDSLVALLLA